ncbi:MAG: hypothetical protein D3920_10395 [Candidatus Electrothrix sp. AW2]|nr:hypothetical protein [Candidatus Electrothrix gigas]
MLEYQAKELFSLEVLLDDDASIKQVPESIQLDGHSILWQEKKGEQWTVLIQKF